MADLAMTRLRRRVMKSRSSPPRRLNFVDCIDLLCRSQVWTMAGWIFDLAGSCKRVDRVRQFRNQTMHFHSPVS